MKKIILVGLLSATSFFISSCKRTEALHTVRLTPPGIDAVAPYLSHDNQGNPVLCWTEKNPKDSLYYLKYAIFNDKSGQFGDAILVPETAGISLSAESMGKIAFKEDGTIIAFFSKSFPDEKNKYAGAIYYSISEDNGAHWSTSYFLHTDTLRTYGRSFFDVSRLADGEVGAIWLDGRFGDEEKGSALFFARTEKGEGFDRDTCLDKNTCECCRTEILTDSSGHIHIAYRGIQFPSGVLGKQVRDMVYTSSIDNGRTFSSSKVISKDQWEIQGCPHTGPTLAATQNALHAIWFTGGGMAGLYHSALETDHTTFKDRMLMSKSGRHPQMVDVNGKLAIVWEENVDDRGDHTNEAKQNHSNMAMNHENMGGHSSLAGTSRIILTIAGQDGKIKRRIPVSDTGNIADHAVIAKTGKGVLMAWVQGEQKDSGIYYSFQLVD